MLHAIRSSAARGIHVATKTTSRNMGSHAAPEWTGIDKVVRGVFPEDYQLAGAIIGGYVGLITIFSLKSKMSPAPEPVVAAATPVSPSAGDIPSVDSEAFSTYIENEDNLMRWIDEAEK
eukprot:CAMPEP_0184855124 /NCGR_PEP_ID=MMETSP0580-20130426/443_1 /TAXON_ID=1118495 /ORGANISM="Dactyliosolen fragilissimus" /LENGTH=118 /DNA_ID=CAMNT_0027349553 /DNA_START=50 /DNA_END=406 /DNA_ORIENTATION=+